MCLAGNYVQEDSRSLFCQLVSSSPSLQAYVAHKIYFSILENMQQESLVICGVWTIGEYGDLLVNGNAVGTNFNFEIIPN
jgi:AP-1 complex subunit gamma-1